MGKTLKRYLVSEMAGNFAAGLGVFTFILLVARILELADLVLSRGVAALQVLRLFTYILPSFLELTIPMAMLLAVVVAFGRLASDGELTAMRASGISLFQMLKPVLMFAAVVALLTVVMAVFARPWGNRGVEHTIYEIAKTKATAALRPRVFNPDFGGMVIYVDSIDSESGALGGIMLSDRRDSWRRTTVFAATGSIVTNEEARTVYLHLLDGTSLSFHAGQESYDRTGFASLEVNLNLDEQIGRTGMKAAEPREMSWRELRESRAARLSIGDPAIEENIEIHRKFVVAASSFVLALIGLPLGIRRATSVRSRSLAVSIAVILGYYVMLSGAMTLARNQVLQPAVVLWLPNLLLAAAGTWTLSRAARDRWLYPSFLRRLGPLVRKLGTKRAGNEGR
jgi:lipopolysaccharide export system permease protein